MRIIRHLQPSQFLGAAGPLLEQHEVENTLLLGIASSMPDTPQKALSVEQTYFATVERGGRVFGAALRTPGRMLQLSRAPDWSVHTVACDLLGTDLPGVVAPAETAEYFAATWAAGTPVTVVPTRELRLHDIREAPAPAQVPGKLRELRADDEFECDMIVAWIESFVKETGAPITGTGEELATRASAEKRLFVWDDGMAVSMAMWSAASKGSVRINLVYTPDLLRSRGYAAALVTALTRELLAKGHARVCLFTDLANTISNHIYSRIGFCPVADFRELSFRPVH